jgi:hypothetical protein
MGALVTQALSLQVAGLATDPGPFTAAPDGAMVEAQNVVVLRPGVLEPRPGTAWFKDATLKAGSDDAAAMHVDTDINIWVVASSPWIIRKSGTTTTTGPSSFISGKIRFAPTGGRLLLTSENGVCTLPEQLASPASGSATVAYRAGMPQPYAPRMIVTTAAAGYPAGANWLANGDSVAYRVTLARLLANGTLVESPPSGRVVVTNSAGAARGVLLTDVAGGVFSAWYDGVSGTTGQAYGGLIAGDILRVYRSPTVTGTPTDEMTLRTVLVWNATYGGFVSVVDGAATPWFDGLADSAWTGPALYTNDTQEGGLLANFRPEYARDITLYNGMTFYAGAMTSQRVDVVLKNLGTRDDPSQTINSFAFTGDITSGTNTILNCTNIRSFSLGQVITLTAQAPGTATASFPLNVYVTAINVAAATVTLSANTGATTVGVGAVAWDWIETTTGVTTSRLYHYAAVGAVPARHFTSFAYDLDNRWNGDQDTGIQLRAAGESQTQDIGIAVFRVVPTDASFTFKSSKPFAWDRYVGDGTAGNLGITSTQQGGVAELRWSKLNEPEHCPVLYRTTVGDAAHAIRRIVVARNSLLIFKDDGLFQCYGKSPDPNSGLAFELLDRTILIPSPKDDFGDEPVKWVGRFDDRVYAMTTRGPMQIGDSGARPVGAPILESLRRRFQTAYGSADESRRALMIDTASRRVGFFYDLDGTGDLGSVGYVLDVETGIWTYWKFAREVADFGYSGPYTAFAGGYSYGYFLGSRTMLDDATVTVATLPETADTWPTETCTINTVTGSGPYTVTIAAGSEWTPVVGDLLIRDGVAHDVSAITSATVFTTVTQPTTGAATWREGFECRCVWSARAEGSVGVEKQWIRLHVPFELQVLMSRYVDSSTSTGRLKTYFRGYRNTDAAIEQFVDGTQVIGLTPWPIEPSFKSIDVPDEVALDWALRVGFSVRQACSWFATAGMTIEYEIAGLDVQR